MNYNKDPGGLVPNPVAVKVSFCLYAPFDHLNKDLFFPPSSSSSRPCLLPF